MMKLTNGFDISASALTAQRLRMDVISSNIANADTTRARLVNGKWVPYARKVVTIQSKPVQSFDQLLQDSMQNGGLSKVGEGVSVTKISDDTAPFKRLYDPGNPDADVNGFVLAPNVDVTKEMVDMIAASRSYEANVTALNASKGMITKALEIGK
jgi:flagellar basal-body rod protein FlgC